MKKKYISLIIFLILLFVIRNKQKEIIILLLSFELLSLKIILLVCLIRNFKNYYNISFCLIILTIRACEVAVGLSFLVRLSFFNNNSSILSENLVSL